MNDADKVYAVIDTNVIVSAMLTSNKESNPSLVVNALNSGNLVPLYNDDIESEYRRVLNYPKFNLTDEQIDIFITSLRKFGVKTGRSNVSGETFPDPDDMVFYEVRMSVDDSFLVTGNLRHFPKKPFVVTPAEMVAILKERKLI